MDYRRTLTGIALAASATLMGCGGDIQTPRDDVAEAPASQDVPLGVVYTVNYPLQYFAQRIADGAVDVEFPEIDGDPAHWEPSPDDITGFQEADLILLNGARYADWVSKVSLPTSTQVNTGSRLVDRLIMRDDVVTHTHGPGGAHTHGELASITWLDPTLAIEQARAIEAAFSQKWPDSSIRFKEGLTALEADLTELDARLEAVTQQIDEPLVTSHPVYQYLKSRYELDVRSVEFEPDMLPDERALAGLREILSEHKAKWMIWEGDPLPESVELLKTMGLRSVVFDPCANVPAEGDYMDVMRRNAEAIESIAAAAAAP